MAFAFSICRFSVWRGQPANGLPSGSMTSQTRRATFPFGCDHGKMRNVSRSGTRPMSDSSIRVKPSIEEPSNWISPSSAFSNCERGTSTFLMIPRMSVNCRRRNRTPSLSQAFRISTALSRHSRSPCFSPISAHAARRIRSARCKVNQKGHFAHHLVQETHVRTNQSYFTGNSTLSAASGGPRRAPGGKARTAPSYVPAQSPPSGRRAAVRSSIPDWRRATRENDTEPSAARARV